MVVKCLSKGRGIVPLCRAFMLSYAVSDLQYSYESYVCMDLFSRKYLKPLLSVALWSIPLDNGFTKIQEKHISKVEALPAHLHLICNEKNKM